MNEEKWVEEGMTDPKWVDEANDFLREAGLFLYQTPKGNKGKFWDLVIKLSYPRHNPDYCKDRWPRLPPRELSKLWQRAVDHAEQFDGDDPESPPFTLIKRGRQ